MEGLSSIFTTAKLVPFNCKNEEKNGLSWKLWASEVGAECLSQLQVGQKNRFCRSKALPEFDMF